MSQADSHLDLLSAYLDHEATPDEVARVEALLEVRESREVLEEMKALREGVRALPQKKLGADFTARVIAEIRRREDPDGETLRTISNRLADSSANRPAWPKTAVWTSAALALVVILLVAVSLLLPRQPAQDMVQDELGGGVSNEIVVSENAPRDVETVNPQDELASHPELGERPVDLLGNDQEQKEPRSQGPVRTTTPSVAGSEVPSVVPTEESVKKPGLDGLVNVAPGAIQALLFVELAISEQGTKEKAFAELLGRHRVELSEDWKIPGGVERVLLKLPCVDGAEVVVEDPQDADSGHPVDLVYSVMLGAQVNHLQADIQSLPSGIVGYNFSIGLRPKELADNRFVRNRRALMEAGKVQQFLGEAKQMVLSGLLFSRLNTGRNVFAKLEAPAAKPPRERIPVETGADQAFELLFVIHRVP